MLFQVDSVQELLGGVCVGKSTYQNLMTESQLVIQETCESFLTFSLVSAPWPSPIDSTSKVKNKLIHSSVSLLLPSQLSLHHLSPGPAFHWSSIFFYSIHLLDRSQGNLSSESPYLCTKILSKAFQYTWDTNQIVYMTYKVFMIWPLPPLLLHFIPLSTSLLHNSSFNSPNPPNYLLSQAIILVAPTVKSLSDYASPS